VQLLQELMSLKLKIAEPKPRDPNHKILADKKNAAGEHRDKKREERSGIFKHRKTQEDLSLAEKKPEGAPDWHDSDAPDANGRFRELSVNALADWLIKTRNGDMRRINGSLQQQIVFNRNKDPAYASKMERTRAAVKSKLKKD